MKSGRLSSCMTSSLTAEASRCLMSLMTSTEKPWVWRSTSRCRLSESPALLNRSSSGEAGCWLPTVTMALRTSVASCKAEPKKLVFPSNTSSQANHRKTPTSSASTEQCDTNGYPSTTGKTSMRYETTPPDGCGTTITSDQTQPLAATRPNSGWPWPLNSTSKPH
jgi:hypothetical protein